MGPSLKKGGAKKQGQKYQNAKAFHHNKNSKLTKKIMSLPVTGLCHKCTDVINWRKQYRKYKPLTQPKKWYTLLYLYLSCIYSDTLISISCEQKTVRDAYHLLCNPCASQQRVCAKCRESKDITNGDYKSPEEQLKEQLRHDCMVSKMSERHRRSYLRKLERDGPEAVANIKFPVNEDDDFEFGSDFDDDEDDSGLSSDAGSDADEQKENSDDNDSDIGDCPDSDGEGEDDDDDEEETD
jgi:hypothetical protein